MACSSTPFHRELDRAVGYRSVVRIRLFKSAARSAMAEMSRSMLPEVEVGTRSCRLLRKPFRRPAKLSLQVGPRRVRTTPRCWKRRYSGVVPAGRAPKAAWPPRAVRPMRTVPLGCRRDGSARGRLSAGSAVGLDLLAGVVGLVHQIDGARSRASTVCMVARAGSSAMGTVVRVIAGARTAESEIGYARRPRRKCSL